MRIEVTHKYAIYTTETHIIEVTDQEEIDFLNEEVNNVIEFCTEESLKEKFEGDCVEGSWELSWKEVPVLDQIVEALNAAE